MVPKRISSLIASIIHLKSLFWEFPTFIVHSVKKVSGMDDLFMVPNSNFCFFLLLLDWHNCFPFWRGVWVASVIYIKYSAVFSYIIYYLVCIANFIMDKNIEQRVCLKFCIANGISCSESLQMLQKTYGESTLSKTRAYEWHKAFKSGRDVMEGFASLW